MFRFKALLISSLLVVSVSACGNSPESNTATAPNSAAPNSAATPSAPSPASPAATTPNPEAKGDDSNNATMVAANTKAELTKMTDYLKESTDAVQAGEFEKAKGSFKEFDENWEKVEDGIKDQSKDTYKAIEDGMDEVENTLVKPDSPDKDKAIAALNSLSQTVTQYSSSFK